MNKNVELWNCGIGDSPLFHIEGADTIWIDNYTIECEKDFGFYVAEPAPGRVLPAGTTFWFSIDNIKKDIKALRKIESGKLSWKDRRLKRKIIRLAKKRTKEA